MDADAELERLLARYFAMCAAAGIEPLPEDEAREQANAIMALLVPAFDTANNAPQSAKVE